MTVTSSNNANLCIHCKYNTDPANLCDRKPDLIYTQCDYFEQNPYNYCPNCGHVFTIAEQILDENENYLSDHPAPLGYTCLTCNTITIY